MSTDDEICLPGGLRKMHTCTSINNLGMMSLAYLSEDIPNQIGKFDIIKSFIKSIGYKGLFSVEFMITKDKAYFLEVNLRNDGTCYITTQAGVNMPAIWTFSSLGLDASDLSRTFKRKYTYGMNEINYLKYTFKLKHIFKAFSCSPPVQRPQVGLTSWVLVAQLSQGLAPAWPTLHRVRSVDAGLPPDFCSC